MLETRCPLQSKRPSAVAAATCALPDPFMLRIGVTTYDNVHMLPYCVSPLDVTNKLTGRTKLVAAEPNDCRLDNTTLWFYWGPGGAIFHADSGLCVQAVDLDGQEQKALVLDVCPTGGSDIDKVQFMRTWDNHLKHIWSQRCVMLGGMDDGTRDWWQAMLRADCTVLQSDVGLVYAGDQGPAANCTWEEVDVHSSDHNHLVTAADASAHCSSCVVHAVRTGLT